MSRVLKSVCRKEQGIAEEGNTCLETPGTCESCPNWAKPKRIQRKRTKGWKMPANAVYVGRPTRWGNPFVTGRDGKRADCIYLYQIIASGGIVLTAKATWEEQRRAYRAMRDAKKYLRGKDLACWCPEGLPCHADILLEIANA